MALAPAFRAGLFVRNLTVRAAGRTLLDIPNLTAEPGQAVVLRGPSGAGKSTLLQALAGLLENAKGQILWNGADILPLAAAARSAFRRDRVGLIFQDHQLFDELSALDNAAVAAAWSADRGGLRDRAAAALTAFGIAEPDRKAATFSGGERQRIAVARALANDPAVILADEPTASLDRANADRLIADLVALTRQQGRMLIAVSHDGAFHAAADRLLELRDGRLIDA